MEVIKLKLKLKLLLLPKTKTVFASFLYKQEPENTKSQLPVFILMNIV